MTTILEVTNRNFVYIPQEQNILKFTKSDNQGEFETVRWLSPTTELDKYLYEANRQGDNKFIDLCYGLVNKITPMPYPEKWTIENTTKVIIMSELIKCGWALARKILSQFPDAVPEYHDFTGLQNGITTFCTDGGMVFWELEIVKWDIRLRAECRMRYTK